MTSLYWRIGKRIQSEILKGQRADYGKEIVATLSQQLTAEFGRGYSYSDLTRMINFAKHSPKLRLSLHCGDNWAGRTCLLPVIDLE